MSTHIVFSGQVRGVGFRWHVRDCARRLDIKGYVQNLPDGTVEVVCDGPDVEKFVEGCKKGNGFSRVDVVSVEEEPEEVNQGFEIRF